jgi:hypothetical protein
MIYDNDCVQLSSDKISLYAEKKEWTNSLSIYPCDSPSPTITTSIAEGVVKPEIESTTPAEQNQKTKRSCNQRKKDGPERRLPVDFVPSPYTVIIGRGKKISQTSGNARLRVLAASFLLQYSKASNNKTMKTRIVNKMVDIINCACTENDCEAAFVRYRNGGWYEVDGSVAREKCGYTLRDLLADRYESSSKRKVAKQKGRRQRRKQQQQQQQHQQRVVPSSLDQSLEPPKPVSDIRKDTTTFHNDCFNLIPAAVSPHQTASQGQRQIPRLSVDATWLMNQPLMEDSSSCSCTSSVVSLTNRGLS